MPYTKAEVFNYIAENDVKFVRLAFCDVNGNLKNISVSPDVLESAFEKGMAVNLSRLDGFHGLDDCFLYLKPNPETMTVLPWRPQHSSVIRLFCDVMNSDATPSYSDCRNILKQVIEQLSSHGLEVEMATESDFYLFMLDENGTVTNEPMDYAGYLDVSPMDRGENIRREICLNLSQMGMSPVASYHDMGPGQQKVMLKALPPLQSADGYVSYLSTVKTISYANGFHASFMPMPVKDWPTNGAKIKMSVFRDQRNVFVSDRALAESFVAGIVSKLNEIAVFLNSSVNSYDRLTSSYIQQKVAWASNSWKSVYKVLDNAGESSRLEIKATDGTMSVYLAYALLLKAGLYGVENQLTLDPNDVPPFPSNLGEAILNADKSQLVRSVVPEALLNEFLSQKSKQWDDYCRCSDKQRFLDKLFRVL